MKSITTLLLTIFLYTCSFAQPATAPKVYSPCKPRIGDAQREREQAMNLKKNRYTRPTPSKINSSLTLEAMLAPGSDATRWSDTKGAVIEGYVVKVKKGGIETCNCHNTADKDRDTHIEVALSMSAESEERVIVEVTPRWRKAYLDHDGTDWSTDALKALKGHRVRFTGWLFWDDAHSDESENTYTDGDVNIWRATAWELHPVTKIEVLD